MDFKVLIKSGEVLESLNLFCWLIKKKCTLLWLTLIWTNIFYLTQQTTDINAYVCKQQSNVVLFRVAYLLYTDLEIK